MQDPKYTRKRNATLPRTSHHKRDYMRHRAQIEGKNLIDYIEDKAAPERAVKAFLKAKEQSHAKDNNSQA